MNAAQAAANRRSRIRTHLACLANDLQTQLDLENGMTPDEPEGTVVVELEFSTTWARELIDSLDDARSLI